MKQAAQNTTKPQGLESIADITPSELSIRPRLNHRGVRLNIRGRSMRLRRLRRPATGPLRWLLILGPGLIACSAGNDAGGIATYSSVGAKYGYSLIWVMIVITFSLAVVQEMCARLGAATGRGLLDLIRERFGLAWAMFAVGVILLANGSLVITEFVGISAAAQLFGISRFIAVPAAAAFIWYLVVFGNYRRVEKIFLMMTLVFLAYPVAAVLGRPDWEAVARGAFIPTLVPDSDYFLLLISLVGTTITPYMQLFQQSSIVEGGAARRHYGPERVDAYAGAVFSNLMSIAMIIATAATLHVADRTEIGTAADAAHALEPVAGKASEMLFGIGLLGASLLAAAVLPLATSYAIGETFGFSKGVNLSYRRARNFFNLFTGLIVIGSLAALIPNLPMIKLLLGVQALNGVLLPIILLFVLRLVNDERLMGGLKNGKAYNLFGWGTFAMVTSAVAMIMVTQLLKLLGVNFSGKFGISIGL